MGSPWRPRGPDDLEDGRRARIRREVLWNVRPLRRSFAERAGDRVYDVFAILALPAPHIVRAILVATAAVAVAGAATVTSADALPDEPLYAVKLTSESFRLALAHAPEDRASVQLSMAEHRLAEAVRLVRVGRDADAAGVTTAYGSHLASAAAELAAVERLDLAANPLVEGLRQRVVEQQHQTADLAARFAAQPSPPAGAELLRAIASFAPAPSGGSTVTEGIAEHAASVAERAAAVAAQRTAPPAGADARAAAQKAKQDAERARTAAAKAREAAQRTPPPRPTPKR